MEGLVALCDALKANSTLKELKCDPDSNPCHVQILAQKLSAATDDVDRSQTAHITLPSLHGSLANNRLGPVGGEKLAIALKENKTLTSIKYAQNRG